jgi:hypothetical protein
MTKDFDELASSLSAMAVTHSDRDADRRQTRRQLICLWVAVLLLMIATCLNLNSLYSRVKAIEDKAQAVTKGAK